MYQTDDFSRHSEILCCLALSLVKCVLHWVISKAIATAKENVLVDDNDSVNDDKDVDIDEKNDKGHGKEQEHENNDADIGRLWPNRQGCGMWT